MNMVQEIKSDEAALQRRMRVSAKRTREILGLSEEEIERLVTRGELRRQSDGSFDARDIAAWVRWHLRVVDPNGPLYEFLENRRLKIASGWRRLPPGLWIGGRETRRAAHGETIEARLAQAPASAGAFVLPGYVPGEQVRPVALQAAQRVGGVGAPFQGCITTLIPVLGPAVAASARQGEIRRGIF